MCANHQLDLPTNQATLEVLRLQAEIRKSQAETQKLHQETGWNLRQALTVFVAILGALTPLIVGGFAYRHQVKQFVHTLEREQEFRVTSEFIDLVVLLTGDDANSARAGALALAEFGRDAAPFLIENLNIAHNEEVYATIATSLRLVAISIEDIEERKSFLKYADNQLLVIVKDRIQALVDGRLDDQLEFALTAQIRTARMLRTLAKNSGFELEPIVAASSILYKNLQSTAEDKEFAKEILNYLASSS